MSARTSASAADTSADGSPSRYPDTGCVLAIEFKKVFMDEWSGEPDVAHITEIAGALAAAVQPTLDVLAGNVR